MNKNTPIFSKFVDKTTIIGVASSGYLYSVYTFLPDHIYDPLVTVVPTTGAISSLFLPRLLRVLRKNSNKNNANKSQAVVIEQTNDGNQVTVSEDIEESSITEESTMHDEYNNVQIDETIIQELIDKKLANTLEDINNTKQQLEDSLNTINRVKSEIDELKNNVNELKNAFETTLVDFKAFQTEIANPLNFMRKYFESIDIKNLSDPTLPLKINDDKMHLDKISNTNLNKEVIVEAVEPKDEKQNNYNGREEVKEIVENISTHGLDLTPYINNDKISLANIMELIYSVGEFIEKFGSHYHEVLSTQCKILGLNKEQEELLYNIADTLDKSKTSADIYIESLYKLATIMGIKDESVDAIYAKLKRKKKAKKNKKR
ncbi:MAG: hypothetical protein KatS3mg003_0059 [Candidatus Nitrosocaldaceae archaeon]|nr:MAG: hypothetical protein KatS3mg003_0059 [Candidatus Nitrosocaldaceae archaeon]